MEFENNEQILQDLMDQLHTLHEEILGCFKKLKRSNHNEELNRKLKSIQALFL
jgi:hypothetical protein